MAILLPVLLLIVGIPLIFVVCRWRHRRRMDELNARERFLSYEGDIRAEPVGDSTLQVGWLISWLVGYSHSTACNR